MEGVSMVRTLLYPPSSPLAFAPASFYLPYSSSFGTNMSLTLNNCTIWTLCQTLSSYHAAFPSIGTFTPLMTAVDAVRS